MASVSYEFEVSGADAVERAIASVADRDERARTIGRVVAQLEAQANAGSVTFAQLEDEAREAKRRLGRAEERFASHAAIKALTDLRENLVCMLEMAKERPTPWAPDWQRAEVVGIDGALGFVNIHIRRHRMALGDESA